MLSVVVADVVVVSIDVNTLRFVVFVDIVVVVVAVVAFPITYLFMKFAIPCTCFPFIFSRLFSFSGSSHFITLKLAAIVFFSLLVSALLFAPLQTHPLVQRV